MQSVEVAKRCASYPSLLSRELILCLSLQYLQLSAVTMTASVSRAKMTEALYMPETQALDVYFIALLYLLFHRAVFQILCIYHVLFYRAVFQVQCVYLPGNGEALKEE